MEKWHNIYGYQVFTQDGKITRGIIWDPYSNNWKTAYPYRWNKKYKCWIIETGITVNAFRATLKRGYMTMK